MISAGLPTYKQNDLHTALDTLSIKEDGTSSADSFFSYATYGTGDAIVSGVVGLYNTGVALGESLGAWDGGYKLDEAEAIEYTLGTDASEFYGRHKEGIDAAGFVLSSLVPGLVAVKALRGAMKYGTIAEGMQVATGLRNSESFALAAKAALETPKASLWTNPVIQRAYFAAGKQQFLEAAVFDAAVSLTTNQNSFVNREDYGFFEAAWKQSVEFAPYTLAGGAIGTGIEAFRIKGILERGVKDAFKSTSALSTPLTESLIGIGPGNAISEVVRKSQEFEGWAVEAADKFALRRQQVGRDIIESTLQAKIGELNAGGEDIGKFLYEITKKAAAGTSEDAVKLDSLLAFSKSVGYTSEADLKSGMRFFFPEELGQTRSAYGLVEGKTAEELQTNMAAMIEQVGGVLPQGRAVDSDQFVLAINEALPGVAVPAALKDKLIFTQLADIKGRNSALRQSLDSVLKQELDTLSRQKVSGLGRTKYLTQLLEASRESAPHLWQGYTGKMEFKELSEWLGGPIGSKRSVSELFSAGGELLSNPATREMAAQRYPQLAEFLAKENLLDKPWNSTTAYLNMRTGQVTSAVLPGFKDFAGEVKLGENSISHSGLAKSFKVDPNLFKLNDEAVGSASFGGDKYLQYDAMWHYAATKPQEYKGGLVSIQENNLPALERAVVDWQKGDSGIESLFYGSRELRSAEEAKKLLLDEKFVRKVRLVERGVNENVIAKVLHMDVEDVMGSVAIPDKLLMEAKKYDQAEVVKVSYANRPANDFSKQAFIYSHIGVLRKQLDAQMEMAVTKVLGADVAAGAPKPVEKDLVGKAVGSVSPQENRAGFIKAFTSDAGTLRERASLVGKYFSQVKAKVIKEVDEGYANAFAFLNRNTPESQQARIEFALTDNLIKSGQYTIEGGRLVSREAMESADEMFRQAAKEELARIKEESRAALLQRGVEEKVLAKEWAKNLEKYTREAETTAIQKLNAASESGNYIFDAAAKLGTKEVPASVALSPQVQKIWEEELAKQTEFDSRSFELAKAQGQAVGLPTRWIRPAQPDLSRYKFNAFVVPNHFMEGSDARKFIITAETAGEFEAKLAQTREHFGEQWKIISTKTDVKLYKEMLGQYDSNLSFHAINFDANKFRKGQTGELVPNVDLSASETLERRRQLAHKRELGLLNEAIKVHYRNEFETLQRLDLVEGKFTRDILDKGQRESDSIWQDTQNLYLSKRSFNAGMENLWGKVNDFVGGTGAQVLDRAYNAFFRNNKAALTQENFQAYNAHLDGLGFKSPLKDYFGTILTSPDPAVSSSLSTSMRILSNLHSTFMLRLDPINNAMQVISSPILALPVVQEVKRALGDDAFDALLSVRNPAGVKEASAGKLLAESYAKLARPTEETKQFVELLTKKGIISDYVRQYHLTTDFGELTGRHTAKQIDQAIQKIADVGGKLAGFNKAEESTRFVIANATWELAKRAGYSMDEAMPIIASSVDKVHGVYLDATRAGLMRGVVGQGVGLYMTYFFNLMQQFGRGLASSDRKRAAIMGAMQSSLFGLGSLPGFQLLNQQVAKDFGGSDFYSLTNADQDGWGKYMMYGTGSHVFGFNVDVFSRGNLTPRHSTVVPLNPADWAVVGRTASVLANIVDTAGNLLPGSGVDVGTALAQGIAHNSLSRPLQGVGTLLAGEVTTKSGQVLGDSYGFATDTMFSTVAARLLGSRPTAEGIMLDSMYRKKAYQASVQESLKGIGGDMQLAFQSDGPTSEDYSKFARKYREAGGDRSSFNKYWISQIKNYSQPQLEEFKKELEKDGELGKLHYSLK